MLYILHKLLGSLEIVGHQINVTRWLFVFRNSKLNRKMVNQPKEEDGYQMPRM